MAESKKSARVSLRIPSADIRLVAPHLFIPEDRRLTQERVVKQLGQHFQDFSLDVADIENLPKQLYKTGNVLSAITRSCSVKLYLVDKAKNEIYYCSDDQKVKTRNRVSWKIESGKSITAYVAWSKEAVMTNNLYADDRYPDGILWSDTRVTCVICVPVLTRDNECSVVIELYRNDGFAYEERDLDVVTLVGGWMGSALEQHQTIILQQKKMEVSASLLKLTENFISESVPFENMVAELLHMSKTVVGAQRGTLYILNRDTGELNTEVFDQTLFSSTNNSVQKKLRRKLTAIASMTVATNQTLNIEDAYKDKRFDKQIDLASGFLTRSVLCKPIADAQGCAGILQLVNKMPVGRFDATDEDFINIFGAFCSILISLKQAFDGRAKVQILCNIYDNIVTSMVKKEIMAAQDHTTTIEIPTDFLSYSWYPKPHQMQNMIQFTYFMLNDMFGQSILDSTTTMGFIQLVQQHYQQVAFHNFEHAFLFTHCVYNTLKLYTNSFDVIEKLSLMVAGLCHDLDHPGYSNAFLKLSNHPFALLYDEPFLENHHCWMGQLLLQKSDFLVKLSTAQHTEFINYFRQNIMATDLNAHLLHNRNQLEDIIENFVIDWTNNTHRCLIRGLIMTSADLCGQVKPFRYAEPLVKKLFVEFYAQGDKEKALGMNPCAIMDRDKSDRLAEFQVDFLRIICLPCFKLMKTIFPNSEPLHVNSMILKTCWLEIIAAKGVRTWNPETSYRNDEDEDVDSTTKDDVDSN